MVRPDAPYYYVKTHMIELHLIMEAKLSEVAGKGTRKGKDVPCNLWALCGALPPGIELDEPHALIFTHPDTKRPIRDEEHLLHDLSYEEFLEVIAMPSVTQISAGLTLIPQAIPAVLTAKKLAESLNYDVRLYETCDY